MSSQISSRRRLSTTVEHAVGVGQRGAQRVGIGHRHEPVVGDALGRVVRALVGDQRRSARVLLAQLEPPARDREVGVALAQQAAVLRARRERALERPAGILVVRLELYVAGGLHRREAISGAF